MFFIEEEYQTRYEVKKSLFLSFVTPYSNFQSTYEKLKIDHPKANHVVWAYRYLNEYDQVVENQTDDGEPKGCAGPPTLSVLRGEDIINSAVLTVRYFGGIKLGKGGMIRGYSGSVKEVLNICKLVKYEKRIAISFVIGYALVKQYEHFFKSNNIDFSKRTFEAESVKWKILFTDKEKALFDDFRKN